MWLSRRELLTNLVGMQLDSTLLVPRFYFYNKIYKEFLTPTPKVVLPSMLPGSVASQKQSLLRFFLSAAWQASPLFWKTDTSPSLTLWVSTINDIMRMEEMLALDNDTFQKFSLIPGDVTRQRRCRRPCCLPSSAYLGQQGRMLASPCHTVASHM